MSTPRWADLVDEEENVSPPPLNRKLSPQALEFVPKITIAKKNEQEALASGFSPINAYASDLGDDSFDEGEDEDEDEDMLDICFDKVSRDGDISPRHQRSGSNKNKKKTHERQHSWDGKVTGEFVPRHLPMRLAKKNHMTVRRQEENTSGYFRWAIYHFKFTHLKNRGLLPHMIDKVSPSPPCFKPTGRILKSSEKGSKSAPFVVSFSSRGPNAITSDILKLDLSALGVDILAAWSEGTTVTGNIHGDKRVVPYNIISGTSMACPHATAAALYVKSFNPTMSPTAIKSALMTTATPMSSSANSEAEFAYGSGQINPIKAAHPGLVYDMGENDYVKFLCGQGYSTKNLRIITGDKTSSCSTSQIDATVWDLNYPSFTISSSKNLKITRVFHRTVTNVGTPVSTYRATIVAP
ncbi:hypothetical protein KY285_016543 [Solanum tuberosum]|nr:hypothetical protein KY284_016555 [Solanum tuberosum]KAH0702265.1 hypothetical protein KY285_016543 [Solanum tuberosum]